LVLFEEQLIKHVAVDLDMQGCAHDLTRATGLGFCLSQLPVMVFVMLYYREPHAIIYTTFVHNATVLDVNVTSDEYGLSVLFLIGSAMCVVMSLMTSQLQDGGLIDNMTEFTEDLGAQLYMWSATLWTVVVVGRLALVSMLCSPADLYFVTLVVLAQAYAMSLSCAPRAPGKRAETISVVIYMVVVAMVYVEMQSRHGLKLLFWTAQIMCDVLLMVGHSYDGHPNMETVANCRIFYCCASAALLILVYVA